MITATVDPNRSYSIVYPPVILRDIVKQTHYPFRYGKKQVSVSQRWPGPIIYALDQAEFARYLLTSYSYQARNELTRFLSYEVCHRRELGLRQMRASCKTTQWNEIMNSYCLNDKAQSPKILFLAESLMYQFNCEVSSIKDCKTYFALSHAFLSSCLSCHTKFLQSTGTQILKKIIFRAFTVSIWSQHVWIMFVFYIL